MIYTDCPEKYFRTATANPCFDDFINQLNDRFNNHKIII